MRRTGAGTAATVATAAVAVVVAMGLGGGVAGTAAASAGDAPLDREEHCVVHVIGQEPDGELRTTDPVCSTTRPTIPVGPQARAADWAIGVHYDGAGFSGGSFTVVGADCTGGWLNINATWNNRISSTLHGCPRIRHFDGFGLTGPSLTTYSPGANLGSMDNRTSSIQYLP